MQLLDDKTIRVSLIRRLEKLPIPPRVILEELRVHNGNAIADVVTVHSHPHCYEIKGDADKIERILSQSRYYDLAFRRTTLVTTSRHLVRARRLAPAHWGILLSESAKGTVRFRHVRSAKPSPSFDKRIALLTLWKTELLAIVRARSALIAKPEKMNRGQLSELIAKSFGRDELLKSLSEQLIARTV